jgi:hypothetical protein
VSNVSIDQLETVISTNLNRWAGSIANGVNRAAEITVKEMVQKTKQRKRRTKPPRGKYARAIASRPAQQTIHARSHVWYVKAPHYRLAHLLNNGHATLGGRRVSGDQHVTEAAEQAKIDFERRIEEVIRNEST